MTGMNADEESGTYLLSEFFISGYFVNLRF